MGQISREDEKLIACAKDALYFAIDTVKAGMHFKELSFEIEKFIKARGFVPLTGFCGHGIGRGFHEAPQVLHYGRKGQGVVLKPGMIFTIEPMINQGKRHLRILNDGWTVVTKDRSLSAQWEHEVLVTETGYEILTISPATGKP